MSVFIILSIDTWVFVPVLWSRFMPQRPCFLQVWQHLLNEYISWIRFAICTTDRDDTLSSSTWIQSTVKLELWANRAWPNRHVLRWTWLNRTRYRLIWNWQAEDEEQAVRSLQKYGAGSLGGVGQQRKIEHPAGAVTLIAASVFKVGKFCKIQHHGGTRKSFNFSRGGDVLAYVMLL